MTLDPAWLFLSLIPSGVGFVLFVYGRKQVRPPQLVFGLLFMVYPYLATSVTTLFVVGGLLSAGLWYALWLGW